MGLIFNRRKTIAPDTYVNVSKGGVSVSKRVGRVTVNSRGRVSIRICKGLRFTL